MEHLPDKHGLHLHVGASQTHPSTSRTARALARNPNRTPTADPRALLETTLTTLLLRYVPVTPSPVLFLQPNAGFLDGTSTQHCRTTQSTVSWDTTSLSFDLCLCLRLPPVLLCHGLIYCFLVFFAATAYQDTAAARHLLTEALPSRLHTTNTKSSLGPTVDSRAQRSPYKIRRFGFPGLLVLL